MNRYSVWIAAFAAAVLAVGHPGDMHAATKNKKKPATESSDDDSTSSTPAPKKPSTPALDLPLPAKKTEGETKKDSTPAPKKSTESDEAPATKTPAKSEKATEKPAEKAAEKSSEKTGAETKPKPEHAPNATVEPDAINEFASQPPRIQQLLRDAINLTRLNLTYTFGSSDPDSGGMDCSGTIYYLLHAHSFADVPRDSSGQYMWARRSGAFFPVVSKSAESPELKELLPGDLMFWTGTYETGRDIPISHVMMYLGREKGSGKRIMFGASDGRSYNGVQRWGVSVFDFKMPNGNAANPEKGKAEFVGYARIPGLRGPAPAPLTAEPEATETAKTETVATTPTPTPSKKNSSAKGTKKKKKADPE
ncbi:MAG TPA: NlpC/P60 family protein [Chthoniobacter sp.]|nr:NlpC/P60 family protein [Chthoniobacter sp.]